MERRIVRTIKLEPPVDMAGELIHELVVREPTAGLMLEISKLETRNRTLAAAGQVDRIGDSLPVIFEQLTGRPPEILHLLPMSVGVEVSDAIADAMGGDEGKASESLE